MTTWPQISIDTERGYRMCFGCGPDNPIGLKLKFRWDGKTARAKITPGEFYQGWADVLHGGIIMCILDEAMAYAALFEGMHCVTARMQVTLKRQVSIGETLIATASITRKTRKLVETKAAISSKDGALVAEGTATQFVTNTSTSSKEDKAQNNG